MGASQGSLFGGPGKPTDLFTPKLLELAIGRFIFPQDMDAKRAAMEPWVASLRAGRLSKETSIHGSFLGKIFEGILGYKDQATSGKEPYSLRAEQAFSDGGGSADGALGLFGRINRKDRVLAPIELKGADTDLDRPMARGFTPVYQGWRYANETPDCPWVIISNYRETRLYHTAKTPHRCQRFDLEKLLDLEEFERFYFCLCAQNLISESGPSLLENLVKEAGEEQTRITRDFYSRYRDLRLNLIEHLIFANQAAPRRTIIEKAQKLLDRALFIAFCEDRGLLKPNTIKDTYARRQPGTARWAAFDGLFKALRNGDAVFDIPAYNGGLFAPDSDLDILLVPDDVADIFQGLARFDFTSQLDVDILGHVFEQSITELEEMRKKILFQGLQVKEGRRKKQGIVYTASFITHFIYERTVGRLLMAKRAELDARYKLADAYDEDKRRAATLAFWREYGAFLESLKILDLACGSGAFLIAVFDALALEYQAVNKAIEELTGQPLWPDVAEIILTKNLYGVDLAPESVEITKLALWLKTAQKDRKLTSLDHNIRCGNSLVEDENVDPLALSWKQTFPEVFQSGGFDVVLSNPPYVRIQNFASENPAQAEHFTSHYRSAFQNYDLYVLFVERGLNLLNAGGVLGYILPNKFFTAEYGQGLREVIAEHKALLETVDLDRNQVFEGVITYPALLFLQPGTPEAAWYHFADGTDIPETLRLLATGQGAKPVMVPATSLSSAPWSFRSGSEGVLLDRLKAMRPTLREVTTSIFQGLVTSADPVYILEDRGAAGEGYRRLFRPASKHKGSGAVLKDREVVLEETFLKPLFKDGHMEPFFMGPPGHRIIFPYDLSGEKAVPVTEERLRMEAPKTWAWFQEHEGLLRMREKGKMNREGWYCYVYPKSLDAFDEPKLIVPGFSQEQRFVYDADSTYFMGRGDSGYGIRLRCGGEVSALYTLAILNSPQAGFFQSTVASAFQGGYYSSGKRYLAQIPILEADEQFQKDLAALTRDIITLKSQRFGLLESGRHRLRTEVIGEPFAKLSAKLKDWSALEFKGLQDELHRGFKKTIPFQDRPHWEKLIADTRNQVQTLTRQIETITADLNAKIYELYGLSKEEIEIVEGA